MEKMKYMLREQKLEGHPEVEEGTRWGSCMLTLQGNNNGDSQAAHPQRWDQSRHTARAENTVKRSPGGYGRETMGRDDSRSCLSSF